MNPDQTHTINQVGGSTASEPAPKPPGGVSGTGYNMRCPAVKRLMREAAELARPEYDFSAQPSETNLFEWHFTIRGPEDSEFQEGVYHGRILFPSDYPMKPPAFVLLTPNGRFQTDEKICLSISNYHPETWLPSWSIRTALVALRSFMTTPGNEGAIGAVNYSPEERKKLALQSRKSACPQCGPVTKLLASSVPNEAGDASAVSTSPDSNQPTKEDPQNATGQSGATCTKEENNQETATASASSINAATETDNLDASEVPSTSHSHSQRQLQPQNEPVKNILYDFGIGCFVVLILALCLRRLLVLFLRL